MNIVSNTCWKVAEDLWNRMNAGPDGPRYTEPERAAAWDVAMERALIAVVKLALEEGDSSDKLADFLESQMEWEFLATRGSRWRERLQALQHLVLEGSEECPRDRWLCAAEQAWLRAVTQPGGVMWRAQEYAREWEDDELEEWKTLWLDFAAAIGPLSGDAARAETELRRVRVGGTY